MCRKPVREGKPCDMGRFLLDVDIVRTAEGVGCDLVFTVELKNSHGVTGSQRTAVHLYNCAQVLVFALVDHGNIERAPVCAERRLTVERGKLSIERSQGTRRGRGHNRTSCVVAIEQESEILRS